jgi:L-alanine-DL-glutamate epimerase-like enolase superfamily enzyme
MDTRVVDVKVHALSVPLKEPFGIATGAQVRADNVLVRVQLGCGAVGLGEAAPFPAVNGETQAQATGALHGVAAQLLGGDVAQWRKVSADLAPQLKGTPSALCAVETALLDALCRAHGMPLWTLMGGAETTLTTDLTITTGTTAQAATAAADIAKQGYQVIKLKVGGRPLDDDVERLAAVARAAPGVGLLLDANGGLAGVDAAVKLLSQAERLGIRVVLLEQPLPRDDHAGQAALVARSAVPVAADESAGSLAEVVALGLEKRAHVVNLKITKSGVTEVLRMAHAARALGLGLMMGGMVETRVATATSAHIAAGLGGFSFVDLDTPLWLVGSPAEGGYAQDGPRMTVAGHGPGHGVTVRGFA